MTTTSRLKICGIVRPEDMVLCASYNIPYIGINFYKGSKRYVSPIVAQKLAKLKGPVSALVAVVVEPSEQELVDIVTMVPSIEVIQFHGLETVNDLLKWRKVVGSRRIWKAIHFSAGDWKINLETFSTVSDLILLEPGASLESGEFGGTGKSFPWQTLEIGTVSGFCWGLAGGINVHNIRLALSYGPDLVDVCSGSEQAPGIKDPIKIEQLCKLVVGK